MHTTPAGFCVSLESPRVPQDCLLSPSPRAVQGGPAAPLGCSPAAATWASVARWHTPSTRGQEGGEDTEFLLQPNIFTGQASRPASYWKTGGKGNLRGVGGRSPSRKAMQMNANVYKSPAGVGWGATHLVSTGRFWNEITSFLAVGGRIQTDARAGAP